MHSFIKTCIRLNTLFECMRDMWIWRTAFQLQFYGRRINWYFGSDSWCENNSTANAMRFKSAEWFPLRNLLIEFWKAAQMFLTHATNPIKSLKFLMYQSGFLWVFIVNKFKRKKGETGWRTLYYLLNRCRNVLSRATTAKISRTSKEIHIQGKATNIFHFIHN